MILDLSNLEVRAISTACAVASEMARIRLGEGEVDPKTLLAGLTGDELDQFIRICRSVEKDFDKHEVLSKMPLGSVAEELPPNMARGIRAIRGGYHAQ